jgi:crotonobetaine/carnitine-CoA ligase
MLGAMASFLSAQPARPDDGDQPIRKVAMVPVIAGHEEFAERFDVRIGSAYGLTEFSSPIVTPYGNGTPGLAGWLRDDFEARVVDDDDMDVPLGATGELVLRPRTPWAMFSGYHDLPQATAEVWRNLWFHTGDAMRLDENGRFYFVDRKKDSLRRRGENVSSFEVEAEVIRFDGVVACAAVAVASEHSEDEIKIVVVPRPGVELDFPELLRFLCGRLPYFMVPRYYESVSELPLTPTQKIKKAELRAAGVTPATWDHTDAGFRVTRHGLIEPSGQASA